MSPTITARTPAPTTTSQAQAQNTQEPTKRRFYVMRALVTIWTFLKWIFGLLDDHDGSVTALATVAIVGLTFVYVKYSKRQWEAMGRANELTQQTLQIGQRAYITIGRKDGVVAELPEPPEGNPRIVLYFQNNGHLPAEFNWGTTINPPIFQATPRTALPPITSLTPHKFTPMTRSRNKKTGDISTSGGVEIGGDSVYVADYGDVAREPVDRLKRGGELFILNGAFESCDELGTYSCKQFTLSYQGGSRNAFWLDSINDCPIFWRKLPPDTTDIQYLRPCLSRTEREQEQADFARKIGIAKSLPEQPRQ
jgi:hypothetical protein